MGSKKCLSFWTLCTIVIVVVSIVGVIGFVLYRDSMKQHVESFVSSGPKCPDNFTFFTDKEGDSFCCKGIVDHYTHTCKAVGADAMCSMRPNVKDPRPASARIETLDNLNKVCWAPFLKNTWFQNNQHIISTIQMTLNLTSAKGFCAKNSSCKGIFQLRNKASGNYEYYCMSTEGVYGTPIPTNWKQAYTEFGFYNKTNCPHTRDGILPLCSLTVAEHKSKDQAKCPGSLPNYARIGKCCTLDPDNDGYDCVREDNNDKNRYCKLNPPLLPGEQLCNNLTVHESSTCPNGLSKITYTLGERERAKYGQATVGVKIPVCFGMDNTCIPDAAIKNLQQKGIYTDKSIDSWKYSCSGWETVNVKMDRTKSMDSVYLG